MNSYLYIATLQIGDCKGIATISAYSEEQALEIANEYWNGSKDYNGQIEITPIQDIVCTCGVKASLKVLCGNQLEEVLNMKEVSRDKDTYQLGDYEFNVIRQVLIFKDGSEESLTTKESDLLLMLVKAPNKLIDRDFILEKIWGESTYYTSRSMDVYITKLRKHFTKDTRVELLNIHGKGFRLIIPE